MNETGHDGDHVSHYEAQEHGEGIKFRKRRETNVFEHGETGHEKVRQYFRCS